MAVRRARALCDEHCPCVRCSASMLYVAPACRIAAYVARLTEFLIQVRHSLDRHHLTCVVTIGSACRLGASCEGCTEEIVLGARFTGIGIAARLANAGLRSCLLRIVPPGVAGHTREAYGRHREYCHLKSS